MRWRTVNKLFSPPRVKQEESFFVIIDGQQAGPLSEKELKQLVRSGVVGPETLAWTQNLPQWTYAKAIPQIYKLLLLASKPVAAKPIAPKPVTPSIDASKKEDILSALVALGYKKQNVSSKIDALLASQPAISVEEAIKELIKNA